MQTFVRHSWCRYQDVCVIFVLETLTKDVHVQRAKESESQSLTECSRRLLLDSYTAVGKRELIGEKGLEEKYVDTRLDADEPFERIPQAW